jgi:hypothetical protein
MRRNFKLIYNPWKQLENSAPRKSYLPNTFASLKYRRGQTPILHTFLPVTFLLADFLHFSQQFPNRRKILSCFDTHIQIL